MKKLNGYTPLNAKDIPKSQGLYAFYLDSISFEKVGLLGKGPFSEEELIKVRNKIVSKVKKSCSFLRSARLDGVIKDNRFSSTINNYFKLTAVEEYPEDIIDKIEKIPLNSIISYISLLEYTPLLSQPIYIGIIKQQTLHDRYYQHLRNFESKNELSNFGKRLYDSGFEWDDIIFSCVEFQHSEEDLELLDILEKQLQVTSRPVLSIR